MYLVIDTSQRELSPEDGYRNFQGTIHTEQSLREWATKNFKVSPFATMTTLVNQVNSHGYKVFKPAD